MKYAFIAFGVVFAAFVVYNIFKKDKNENVVGGITRKVFLGGWKQ